MTPFLDPHATAYLISCGYSYDMRLSYCMTSDTRDASLTAQVFIVRKFTRITQKEWAEPKRAQSSP